MISTLVTPPVFETVHYFPDPIYVYGDPLCTSGFENYGVVNGLGLVTRGLLWQLYDLWFDNDYYSNLATSWTDVDASSGISTTWTSPQFGMFGPYPT